LVRPALKKKLKTKRPSPKARAFAIAADFHARRLAYASADKAYASADRMMMDKLARLVGKKFGRSMGQVYRDWQRYGHLFEDAKGSFVGATT
jgi:hypothetical protein